MLALFSAADSSYYDYSYDPEGNLSQPQSDANESAYYASVYDAYGLVTGPFETTGAPGYESLAIGFAAQSGGYSDIDVSSSPYATGLVYMTHRYYDPKVGRFVNRDPIGYHGGVNVYAYAGNNPITRGYPSGDDPSDDESQEQEALSLERTILKEEEAELEASDANRSLTEQQEVDEYGVSKELLVERDAGTPSEREEASEIVAHDEGRVGIQGEAPLSATGECAAEVESGDDPGNAGPQRFPKTPEEMDNVMGRPGVRSGNPSNKTTWETPDGLKRYRYEEHPAEEGESFNARHHGPHFHVEERPSQSVGWSNQAVTKLHPPGYTPGGGTGFLPGEHIP
jgi:RHS repeat-associated protein